MLSKEYIAGFIDGEGYLGIMKMKVVNRNTPPYRHIVAIKIAQRTREDKVLRDIQAQYGGRIEYRKFSKTKDQADATTLSFINRVEVKNLLDNIGKYLVVKQKQSEVIKEFLALNKMPTGRNTEDGKKEKLKQVEYDKRENLYQKIIKLNRVGKGLAETK
tara:strand:+ start:3832 stop:4311 length:480 start_codon:yes stop_codon:yes gene_type:complete